MNKNQYVRMSLELHLFFDRIMKEHSFFLQAAFSEKEKDLKKVAGNFQKIFSDILDRTITLSDNQVSREFIEANEMTTKDTLEAENITSRLSGVEFNTNLTLKANRLRSGKTQINDSLLNEISMLNTKTLSVVKNLIYFKNDILNKVLSCKMYTTNYPLLITHIMNEAKMYHKLLTKLENKEEFDENYIYEQELFWNNIMKEHAEFIRGLLDPSEKELIITADTYADKYDNILSTYMNNMLDLTDISLKETINFRDFKVAGEEGILNCKVKSIIIPLLADHVVREANHFIRILKSANKY